MKRIMAQSKIHRVKVTEADLNYVGSITIDKRLMEEANMYPNERVQVVNYDNGKRFETYIIEGEKDSGIICLNGAAARKAQVGDEVTITSYTRVDEKDASNLKVKIVLVDGDNNQVVNNNKNY